MLLSLVGAASLCVTGGLHAEPPQPGDPIPEIRLPTLRGNETDLQEHTLVLVFGDLGNQRTIETCHSLQAMLEAPPLDTQGVVPVLLIASRAPREELLEQAGQARYPETILLDPRREVFGAHEVVVVPTVLVVDAGGVLVRRLFKLESQFDLMLKESILAACGIDEPSNIDNPLKPDTPVRNEHLVRADRFTRLGEQLVIRGMHDLAADQFDEALREYPGHVEATIGLADVRLIGGSLDEAERSYSEALDRDPRSLRAMLGLAQISLHRGGTHAAEARTRLVSVLESHPGNAVALIMAAQLDAREGNMTLARERVVTASVSLLHMKHRGSETPTD
jgi:tetratricopeptide (TPR) repeat protein